VSGGGVIASSDAGIGPILITIVATLVIVTLLAVLWQVARTMRAVRATTDELCRESLSLLSDMRASLGLANAELGRVDGLLGTAQSISATADSASRLAYLTLSNPVVKVLAFGTGTARAAKRLRRSRGS
jgi:hypothetical protein